jgi:nucleoside-diphosphate-sugar epimerase
MTSASHHSPPAVPRRLIVGCGYLGERLAARWLAEGARVWGMVRTPARVARLTTAGVEPIMADVASAMPLPPLPEVDTVVWSVGFDRTSGQTYRDVHVEGLRRLLDALTGRPRLIFVSSTGVWGKVDGLRVDETTPAHPDREAGRVLLEAERLLGAHNRGPGTVLRLAGIYGPGRLPRVEDLRAGRPLSADPDSWLNLIHVDDAATVVMAVAARALPGPLYVVSDGHPVLRREFYGHLATLIGSPPPLWAPPSPDARGGDKRVDPRRLFAEIGPSLIHSDAVGALAGILMEDRPLPIEGRPPGTQP